MRALWIVLALSALAGCQSVGGLQPVQLGSNRFQVTYSGPEGAGLSAAQSFCNSRGYAYAAITQHAGPRVTFVCARASERPGGGHLTCMSSASGAKVCGIMTNAR